MYRQTCVTCGDQVRNDANAAVTTAPANVRSALQKLTQNRDAAG
jgi:hypothetical protein